MAVHEKACEAASLADRLAKTQKQVLALKGHTSRGRATLYWHSMKSRSRLPADEGRHDQIVLGGGAGGGGGGGAGGGGGGSGDEWWDEGRSKTPPRSGRAGVEPGGASVSDVAAGGSAELIDELLWREATRRDVRGAIASATR